MKNRKLKVLFLLVAIVMIVSTISFATTPEKQHKSVPSPSDEVDLISENYDEDEIEDSFDDEAIPYDSEEDFVSSDEYESNQPIQNWVTGDLYLTGDVIEVKDIIDGNVFVLAKEVIVTGQIGGDLFACTTKLTIDGGSVYNSVYAVAEDFTLNGEVSDVYAVSKTFTVGENGSIYRDLRLASNSFILNGFIQRNAFIVSDSFSFNEISKISGNLKYTSANEIEIPEGVVKGSVVFNKQENNNVSVSEIISTYIVDALNMIIYTLALTLLVIFLAPKFTERIKSMNAKRAFSSLGLGIVIPITAIIAIVLLLFSSVASNLALASTFLLISVCMSGTAFANIYFGSIITKKLNLNGTLKYVLITVATSLVVWFISHLPFIGGLFGYLVASFGIGILVVNIMAHKETKVEAEVIKE